MKKLVIEFSNERLITPSGLSLVGMVLGKSDFVNRCNRKGITDRRSQPQIKNGDILLTYIGLLCQGKTQYEAVSEFMEDSDYYKTALGIVRDIPSAETLRQRMDSIGTSYRNEILQANVSMLQSCAIQPSALPDGLIPVDIDVTPLDNSKTAKEGVSRTYKGYDGYAPMMAYIGAEGFLANCELREGKQHCQKHTPEFLRETLTLCHQLTDGKLLVRLDAGNDSSDNLGILLEDGDCFIVKHNLRRAANPQEWLKKAQEMQSQIQQPREGKTIYTGDFEKKVIYKDARGNTKEKFVRMVYEVIERTIDKHGQYLLPSDIEVNTWWANADMTNEQVIESYHAHGESEQYHSEIKTDMDVERLPSGKFATNELVMELTILAYNILRMIGQESLKSKRAPRTKRSVKRRRLRTVIGNLILIAGHVTSHARRVVLALGRSNAWRYAFMDIYRRFA